MTSPYLQFQIHQFFLYILNLKMFLVNCLLISHFCNHLSIEMSFLCIHIIRLCPHLPWYGSIMLASRHKHLNMWMSVSQSVQPQTQGEKFFFIHDHEPCNYSIKGQEGVWLCHLGFWPFSSEKYDLPGLPCVRDGRGARSEDYRWCSPVGFVKQWSSAHALVLHNWVGNI